MTAEERREPTGSMDVAAYKREQAKRATIAGLVKKHLGFTNGEIASASYRAFVDALYEAGRSSMQDEAAQVAERMLNGKGIAAAIRALKP